MADRVQALHRYVIGIAGAFAHVPGPGDECGAQAVAHLLRLVVEHLLRQIFPGKSQVSFHGHKAQPDGASGRKQQGAGVVVVALGAEVRLDRIVRQVAGSDDVRQSGAAKAARAAVAGQVYFEEAAVLAAQSAKGVEGLDDARAFRPTAACAAGERNHCHHSCRQGLLADFVVFRRDIFGGVKEICGANVGDQAGGGKTILRQPHAAVAQVRLDLLMLRAIKSMCFEQRVEALREVGFWRALRDEVLEDMLHHALEFRHGVAGGGEAFELNEAHGREQTGFHAKKRGHNHLVVPRRHQRRVALEVRGLSAIFVDREIVDHGFHGEGQRMFHLLFGGAHDGQQALLCQRFRMRSKKKTHAPARHSPEHPEAPEVVAHLPAHAANQRVRVEISGPGNNGLNGAVKIPLS